jgi:ppGpp synthetase/RelA/SpoT-type nucleotidyltranferase
MNESQFNQQWDDDKPSYKAWGNYIVDSITTKIKEKGIDLDSFLKIPAKCRLKNDDKLIDKAFYRAGKNYSDPYTDIEDKVGARFVVLLISDIQLICDIIQENDAWIYDPCKHFEEDKDKDPLLFTYQSVHYILRPKTEINVGGVIIPQSTPCEIQIRTLLQHAHAELTHDAIYKSKTTVKPNVHRTVAKSMALIETTDGFFTDVTRLLNYGPLEEYGVQQQLDALYLTFTGLQSCKQKSSIIIWDEFEKFIDEKLYEQIQTLVLDPEYGYLADKIKEQYSSNVLYRQSIVLFIYWLLKHKRRRLISDWPLDIGILELLANDVGVSTTI